MSNLHLGAMIGRGTFGTVYRGKWHGEVAVKIIDIFDEGDGGAFSLDAFKREVVTLHKLRHDNLVLFMGACTTLPDLAIVTQLSKVSNHLHVSCFSFLDGPRLNVHPPPPPPERKPV